MPYIQFNDLNMYYEEFGRGETVLFLHSHFSRSLLAFSGQILSFGGRYHCLYPDFRGHGRTKCESLDWNSRMIADDMADFLDAMGIKAAHLVGYSCGAYVGCYMASQYPDKVKSLVTIGGGAFPRPEGAEDFLQFLREKGIVASLAHSDADCEQVKRACDQGLKAMTHFYSGMSGVTRKNAYRAAGAIEAGYLLDQLFVEVIADGCHLPGDLLQLIYKIKGAHRICLVTDSMRGAGMPEGEYILGGREGGIATIVEEGVAKLPDRSAFAGSVATMDRLVRTMYELTTAPLHEVIHMASLTPAMLMGIDGKKGSVSPGKDADLLLLNEKLEVNLVMVRGRIISFPE